MTPKQVTTWLWRNNDHGVHPPGLDVARLPTFSCRQLSRQGSVSVLKFVGARANVLRLWNGQWFGPVPNNHDWDWQCRSMLVCYKQPISLTYFVWDPDMNNYTTTVKKTYGDVTNLLLNPAHRCLAESPLKLWLGCVITSAKIMGCNSLSQRGHMGAMASQITRLTIVYWYSTVYWGADQRKHQSFASLAFVRGIRRSPVNSPHKWTITRKMFPFDDVIMLIHDACLWTHFANILEPTVQY